MGYLLYGILLTALKYCMNDNFKSAPRSQKLQHVVEATNIPGQKLELFPSSQKSVWSGSTIPLFYSFLQKYMAAQSCNDLLVLMIFLEFLMLFEM